MAEDARLALLVTESALVHAIDWPRSKSVLIDIDAMAIAGQPDAALAADPAHDATPEDAAYVIYTSGSTGKPKGVVVPHRAVVNFLDSMARVPGLAPGDRLLAVTTLSFDIAVLELLLPLAVGAEVVLASRDAAVDPQALRLLVESTEANVMQATPSTWRMLLESGWQGHGRFKALVGGEGLPTDLATKLLERTGQLWNMYGPTETTVWSTCWQVESPERGISIGRPIANTQVHVLDERLQPCAIGLPGEIYIAGDGVTTGYLHRPELTAERFVPDPFRPGHAMYRTGDRGRWRHDGLLDHMGRLDFQVKVRGYRIELGEIESTLAAHPQVGRSLVIVREDQPGDLRLVAYVVAPRTDAEAAVVEVWKSLLGVEQVSVTDNFFDLGGHSLLAMRAVIEIEKRLGLRLNVRRLIFESLAQIAGGASDAGQPPGPRDDAPVTLAAAQAPHATGVPAGANGGRPAAKGLWGRLMGALRSNDHHASP
jgi:amino acid adenylation domain-containing protein